MLGFVARVSQGPTRGITPSQETFAIQITPTDGQSAYFDVHMNIDTDVDADVNTDADKD